MNREQIEAMIREYRANAGRVAHLETKIRVLEQELRMAMSHMIEDEIMPGHGLDGMPHGTDVSRQVEEIACRYADGLFPDDIRDMQAELIRLRKDRDACAARVSYVDAWLKALNDKQRWIIVHQMIDGETWREIAGRYSDRYGSSVSKDTLKRIRESALAGIMEIVE
ncbi:MAG: hypothetical protein IKE04_05635 [Oscillospiraceae bacterium]|nr:hypothetical protein [Oscillospiraceae bacterium]